MVETGRLGPGPRCVCGRTPPFQPPVKSESQQRKETPLMSYSYCDCEHPEKTFNENGSQICMACGDAIREKSSSQQRKETPLWSGVMRYFPDALAAVARVSFKGNEKHNPGQPLHWAREKSSDHGDCILRHQVEPEAIDPDSGETHAAAVAWRALAQLQLIEEKRKAKK